VWLHLQKPEIMCQALTLISAGGFRHHPHGPFDMSEGFNIMASISRTAVRPIANWANCSYLRCCSRFPRTRRNFQSGAPRATDGVFRDLTAVRVRTPWVEALRQQQQDGTDPSKASGKQEVSPDRKLEPKRMSDSYHSVVSTLCPSVFAADCDRNRYYRSLKIHGC
jgi:hypothetical protein